MKLHTLPIAGRQTAVSHGDCQCKHAAGDDAGSGRTGWYVALAVGLAALLMLRNR